MSIHGISPIRLPGIDAVTPAAKPATSVVEQAGKKFSEVLSSLNESQLQADDLATRLAAGENVDLHQVMIGLEENDVNFRVALGIRDRLVEAYREVMRMQV
jgi:flagellar hook-basal body complex protein FliE